MMTASLTSVISQSFRKSKEHKFETRKGRAISFFQSWRGFSRSS